MDAKTDTFNTLRPRLTGLAYRMLGSRADAEDVLHDAWMRWQTSNEQEIRSSEAWLKTTVTRLAIDRLRKAKVERESYVGPWLPEPLSDADMNSPELALEREDDVSIAFMTLLETLSPEERAVFVLHDILDDDYADIAEAMGKSEAACRQMIHRARERVSNRRRRFIVDDTTRRRMLEKFIAAAHRGDRTELLALFAGDATMISDGGGKAVALLRQISGAARIAWFWFALAQRSQMKAERRIVRVNGELALASFYNGRLHSVATVDTDGERIHAVRTIANPDKLRSFKSLVTRSGDGTSSG